ncbi:MAG: DNA repair protein RecO [Acidocella sp.]|nr:DNA repair protein RecO [Acidocella sp.]
MEWESPALVIAVKPYGEADSIVSAFTASYGRRAGWVPGGQSRRLAGMWQKGNLLKLRWHGREPEGLGRFSAELAHPSAALALHSPDALAIVNALCAVADGTLPEREPQPAIFAALLPVLAGLHDPFGAISALVRWEVALLAALGYGMDLSCCAITGAAFGLTHVSPRTGRAVTRDAAANWAHRLLPLPKFLLPGTNAAPEAGDLADGLALTAHFLARDVFGARHFPLPLARVTLYERVLLHSQGTHSDHAG